MNDSTSQNLFKALFGENTRIAWENDYLQVPEGETGIIWLINPEFFPYVRTIIVESPFRIRKPGFVTDGLVLGYSMVGNQEKGRGERFKRRLFYLTKEDLKPTCVYRLQGNMPFEGVRPFSVKVNVWGER